MSRRMLLLCTGSLLFLGFILFSFLVHKNVFTTLDFNTTVRLQDNLPRRLDPLFSLLSDIGSFEPMTIALVILAGFFFITKRIIASVVAFSLYVGFHLIELFGKYFVDHPPPPQFMLRTEHIMDFPQFHVRQEFSYPSGHSGRAVFFSTILIVLIVQNKSLPPVAKIILCGVVIGYDVLMLTSRVYLGEHWTTDVIGGSLLGLGLGIITGAFLLGKNSGEGKSLLPKFKVEIKRVE